ncbi:unnamed protein product [Diamesa serratosioi]
MGAFDKLIVLAALFVFIQAELTTKPIVRLENNDESDESDYSNNNHNGNSYQRFNSNVQQFSGFGGFNGGNTFTNNGGQSSNVYSSNGNNIIVNRRMGTNNEEETYISVSRPIIKIDGDYFTCSTLICPKDSYKCVVKSETFPSDTTKLKTLVECQDKNDIVLERKEYTENNPYPDLKPFYKRYASVDREGGISTEDSNGQNVFNANKIKKLTKEEQEEITRNIDEQNRRLNDQLQQQQQHFQEQQQQFQKQMEEMQTNLQNNLGNAFGNGFPFQNGNPFGNGFPFQNGNPFVACSTLVCTIKAHKCVVKSTLSRDNKKIRMIVECQDKNNTVLQSMKYIEDNPYLSMKYPYKKYTTVDRDGKILRADGDGQNIINSNEVNSEKTKKRNKNKAKEQSSTDSPFGKGFPFNK